MAKGENQKLKMLYLVKIFTQYTDDQHSLTMQEIIKKLESYEVSADRKTLYLDFAELDHYGLDIISEKIGRNTYYHLGKRQFELPELKLLVDSVQAAKFITDKKSKQLILNRMHPMTLFHSCRLQLIYILRPLIPQLSGKKQLLPLYYS